MIAVDEEATPLDRYARETLGLRDKTFWGFYSGRG